MGILLRPCLKQRLKDFETSKFMRFFNGNRWFPGFPFWILLCSFLTLWASASSMLSAFTFTVPRHKNLRKPQSCFMSPKEPSTCMLRFILSICPSSLVMRARSSMRYWLNRLDTCRFLLRSSSDLLLLFPLMHSFLYGHLLHSVQLYIVTSRSYPVFVFIFFLYRWPPAFSRSCRCSSLLLRHTPCFLPCPRPSYISVFMRLP